MKRDEIRRKRLAELIAEAGTLKALATAIDTDEAYLGSVLHGYLSKSGTPRRVTDKMAASLERAMKKSEGWMDYLGTDLPATQDLTAQWTPVLGEARAGDQGYFEQTSVDEGSAGYVRYPRERDNYALLVKGNSMKDRINPGDYVVIVPSRRVDVGDLVMCQTQDGRRMIKTLGKTRDGFTPFHSINDQFGTITLDETEIAHLNYAVGPVVAAFYEDSPG